MLPTLRTKSIYEAVVQRRRATEEQRQVFSKESQKFFKDSELKSTREKQWTSKKSFNNSMIAYLQPNKEILVENLEIRRNNLRELLQQENETLERCLSVPSNCPSNPRSKTQYNCDSLIDQRESKRSELANQISNRRIFQDDHELRNAAREFSNSNRMTAGNEDKYIQPQNPVALDSSVCEGVHQEYRSKENQDIEEQQSAERQNENECFNSLQQQIAELKQLEEEADELKRQREKIIMEQARLSDLENERKDVADKQAEQKYGKALLRQHTAALRRRSKQIQENLNNDIEWMSRLDQVLDSGKSKEDGKPRNSRSEAMQMLEMLKEDQKREQQREADMDDLYGQEAADLWKKRNQQWDQEQASRERLLMEILETRKTELDEKLYLVRQLQAKTLAERESLLKQVDTALKEEEIERTCVESNENNQTKSRKPENSDRHHRQRNEEQNIPSNVHFDQKTEENYERNLRAEAEKLQIQHETVDNPISYRGRPFLNQRRRTHLW